MQVGGGGGGGVGVGGASSVVLLFHFSAVFRWDHFSCRFLDTSVIRFPIVLRLTRHHVMYTVW